MKHRETYPITNVILCYEYSLDDNRNDANLDRGNGCPGGRASRGRYVPRGGTMCRTSTAPAASAAPPTQHNTTQHNTTQRNTLRLRLRHGVALLVSASRGVESRGLGCAWLRWAWLGLACMRCAWRCLAALAPPRERRQLSPHAIMMMVVVVVLLLLLTPAPPLLHARPLFHGGAAGRSARPAAGGPTRMRRGRRAARQSSLPKCGTSARRMRDGGSAAEVAGPPRAAARRGAGIDGVALQRGAPSLRERA
eukprot:scaffold2213_cov444-Prasinococcus_capsulatus_cf.AAC.11